MAALSDAAARLRQATVSRRAIARLTDELSLTLDDAYAIQKSNVGRRVADGEHVIGFKLGLTSEAKQRQMGIDEPIFGVLLSAAVHHGDSTIDIEGLIHPRVEPEIVFTLGADLSGPGVTAADALAATAHVCAGIEIIDSRFVDFSFGVADVVADNASAAAVVLSPTRLAVDRQDWAAARVTLDVDGTVVASATGAATLGHPAEATATLANWLGRRGIVLPAGSVVFTGGLTPAHPLARGSTVTATFDGLGALSVRGGHGRPDIERGRGFR